MERQKETAAINGTLMRFAELAIMAMSATVIYDGTLRKVARGLDDRFLAPIVALLVACTSAFLMGCLFAMINAALESRWR